MMSATEQELDGPTDHSDSDDEDLKGVWVTKFQRKWLAGAAEEYAYDNHLNEFCEINAKSPHDGTQYALRAANEMLRVFGEFGPWGVDSAPLEEEVDEDDGPYDRPETPDEQDKLKKKTGSTGGSAQSTEGNSADKARGTKRKRSDDGQSIQAKEATILRRAHIERFRKSYTNWLRYRYKWFRAGDTVRGRHRPSKSGKKSSKSTSADTSGADLAVLMVHEILGLGQATVHVAHPFQLWAKDQPPAFRKSWLKKYKAAGKSRQGRAGAEMQYYARKFHKCTDAVQQLYQEKCSALKEEACARRAKMSERVNTRLDPEDAAQLLENIPYILDPLLTSLSNMLSAKLSLCIGVPDPNEGGRLVIRTLDRGENNDPIPVSFGQSSLFARHIDAFKEYLDGAYSPAELKACAIPGTVPKSPRKSTRTTDGRVVIVVQNMSIPEGENWAKRTTDNDDSDPESGNAIEKRRRRRQAREEREKRLEEDGPPPKRPRGRPRKNKAVEDDEEESDGPAKQKKTVPEKLQRRTKTGRKPKAQTALEDSEEEEEASPTKNNRNQPATTTASGSVTLVDVSTSRGRGKVSQKVSAHRKQLLALARNVTNNVSQAATVQDIDCDPPVPVRSTPRLSIQERDGHDAPFTDESPARTSSPPPPRPRPRPRPTFQKKDSGASTERATGSTLDRIAEDAAEEHVSLASLPMDIDDFEAPPPIVEDFGLDFDDPDPHPVSNGGGAVGRGESSTAGKGKDTTGEASSLLNKRLPETSDRVTRFGRQIRVPPTGDSRIRGSTSRSGVPPSRGKPPSTRAASVAPTPPPFNPFDRSGWTDWFILCHDQFSSISTEEWQTVLNLWTRVEGLARFRVGNVVLGYQTTDARPSLLSVWVNTRRAKPMTVPRKDLKKFARDFWSWYIPLQPAWRELDGLDGPLTEDHRPDVEGRDWGELRLAKGRNGLTSIIACLHWWGHHHTLTKGPLALEREWDEAVADITYVLEGVLAAGWVT